MPRTGDHGAELIIQTQNDKFHVFSYIEVYLFKKVDATLFWCEVMYKYFIGADFVV